jgi:hypothetical protein
MVCAYYYLPAGLNPGQVVHLIDLLQHLPPGRRYWTKVQSLRIYRDLADIYCIK